MTRDDLPKLHTKQLRVLLQDARARGSDGRVGFVRRPNRPQDADGHRPSEACGGHECVSVNDLKEVLKDRPHVPNKSEAKRIRQQKARG